MCGCFGALVFGVGGFCICGERNTYLCSQISTREELIGCPVVRVMRFSCGTQIRAVYIGRYTYIVRKSLRSIDCSARSLAQISS
jgi:hypothetical protein